MVEHAETNTCSKVHNILILDNELGMGGVEKKLYEFVANIDTEHFRVKVCCLKEGGFFKEPFIDLGTPFYEGLLRHKFDVLAFRKLVRIIKEEDIDLIYTFIHPNTVLFATMAKLARLVEGVVVSFHATGTAGGKRYVRGFQKPMLRRADALLAVAEEHKRYLVDAEGLDAGHITVIHNGVDTNRYRPGPAPDGLARELGFDGTERIVIAVGSLKPLKGFDFLLRAAAGAFANRKDLRLVIVGDGAERNSLEALSESLGVRDRVTFTGVRRDVDALLRMSDLLVLSSWTEAFPNVVLEAMATGLPVISTDVGSVREVVREGENGLIVPPKDVDALNSALRSMLADPGRMAAFGEAGRKIVEESFRLEDMCRKRERVFANILC